MYSPVHRAIIAELSRGHVQLAQLTTRVNKRLKTHYLPTTISARIRDLRGHYETLDVWKGRSRHVYYIARPGALALIKKESKAA